MLSRRHRHLTPSSQLPAFAHREVGVRVVLQEQFLRFLGPVLQGVQVGNESFSISGGFKRACKEDLVARDHADNPKPLAWSSEKGRVLHGVQFFTGQSWDRLPGGVIDSPKDPDPQKD